MELNLALGNARRRSCRRGWPRLEGFCGDVRLRETRFSYFLNLIFQGFRTDEIEVEMDKERSVILRGESYCKEVGMLKWRWRLMSKTGKPFKIPEDVNVGATRGRFERHILHIVMPKFRHDSRFSPYHVIQIHSSHHHVRQPQAAVKVDHSPSCSYTSEVINKDTIYSSTSSLSNAQEKKQQYRRTRRRRVMKISAKSHMVE
ncbi:hypothetical protein SUGI_0333330 [Cryptomeria japonica]|uniref:uncharacterized protein LOC131078383 n=1 Tax=Cryptomeria japonica TaxID=3369 RepID=UPI002408A0DD|nr:uncharacterized protein LOC131078383 [Cryptomeria japonica]GLJ18686.1 hypothetical protein SUGI_0333330 [Cryptomeria japonica]